MGVRGVMQVQLRGLTETDAVLVIECKCGNTRMLDEAGDFEAEEIYVYLCGVPARNLRCYSSEAMTLKRTREGKPECRQRYRISLYREQDPAYVEVAHITPRPRERVLEVEAISFPRVAA
jgi:hypothetical protein